MDIASGATEEPSTEPLESTGPGSEDVLSWLAFQLPGRLPDESLATIRAAVADGWTDTAVEQLSAALRQVGPPLLADEWAVVEELCRLSGIPSGPQPELVEAVPAPTSTFLPVADPTDQLPVLTAVFDAGRDVGGPLAVWCTRRQAADVVRRVWLVEAAVDADVIELTAEIQDRLVSVGEVPPCVEVFTAGEQLTPYHLAALSGSVRLWTDPGCTPPKVARGLDPSDGPIDAVNRPAVTGADRERVLAYLRDGDILMEAAVLLDDVLDPGGATVPLCYRSDGAWVWTEAVAHQLDRHDVGPDPDLVRHILTAAGPVPRLGRLAGELAWTALTGQSVVAQWSPQL